MQVYTLLQTDNHASIPPLKFFTGQIPFLPPNQQRQSTEAPYIHKEVNHNPSRIWDSASTQGLVFYLMKYSVHSFLPLTGQCKHFWTLHELCVTEVPSVLWHCWLGGRKGIRPVKNWVVGCWRGYLSGAMCRFAYGPADAIATHCLLLQ